MEEAVDNIEKQMQKADERLDSLAVKVVNVERDIFADDGTEVAVNNLLKSVTDVKNDYQNLRKDIHEVQDLQKQLSNSLQSQLQLLQSKYNFLKEKISVNVPRNYPGVPKVIVTDASPGKPNSK
ncbi:hypothetical protein PPYR_03137 [Photinus pyralis]|uniref:Ska2 N-terminal domain-containing protein n=1 Tax=Photinus pyralis TaxID=7054 RepID=A0A1Y1MNH3_PHOPY|nr:uncharacterized protein LOC116162055 [Photinus pyralis]KAB0791337.1 hypothetical protein PPYR_03137 [Photinus pyralis]